MASDDHAQLTTVVARLGEALSLLNPLAMVSVIRSVVREVGTPPPGDPDALRAMAAAFRAAATELGPLGRAQGTTERPWQGVAATSSTQVARALADAVAATPAAFEAAAAGLEELAARVEAQRERHAALHRKLREAVHDATHVGKVPMPDPAALDDLVKAAAGLIRGCIAVYTDAMAAADEAAGVFADVAGAARTASGVAGGLDPADAVVLAGQDVVIAGIGGGYDDGVLTLVQLRRAGEHLAALPAVRPLLAAATSVTERAYLLKAVAAGHQADALTTFAAAIHGRDDAWLHHHLSLVDRGGAGTQDRFGAEVDQYDDYTCGTTSVIVARAEADPLYALRLTRELEPPYDKADREEFDRRLSDEQARVHGETNAAWPRQLGTTPAGVADWMNRHCGTTGVTYGWHLVDDTDGREVSTALREVVTAVDGGHAVPILVGGAVPRHYVLVVGHAGSELLIFEPSSGDTVRVPVADFVGGQLGDKLGFDHVQAVVVPR